MFRKKTLKKESTSNTSDTTGLLLVVTTVIQQIQIESILTKIKKEIKIVLKTPIHGKQCFKQFQPTPTVLSAD
jgi:hypothetical protein